MSYKCTCIWTKKKCVVSLLLSDIWIKALCVYSFILCLTYFLSICLLACLLALSPLFIVPLIYLFICLLSIICIAKLNRLSSHTRFMYVYICLSSKGEGEHALRCGGANVKTLCKYISYLFVCVFLLGKRCLRIPWGKLVIKKEYFIKKKLNSSSLKLHFSPFLAFMLWNIVWSECLSDFLEI